MQRAMSVLAFLTLTVHFAAAGDWNSLGRVQKDRGVKVYLKSGQKLKGSIQQVESDALRLVPDSRRVRPKARPTDQGVVPPDDGAVRISRTEIRRVTWRSRKRGALIGLLVGGGAGAVYGAATPGHTATWSQGRADSAAEGGAIIGIMGAIVGAFVGKEMTIYDGAAPH